jgi:hypothetical protein
MLILKLRVQGFDDMLLILNNYDDIFQPESCQKHYNATLSFHSQFYSNQNHHNASQLFLVNFTITPLGFQLHISNHD